MIPALRTPAVPERRGRFRALAALRHRNFRLFWFGQLISLIGTWMQTLAQSWLVLQLTHGNALALGVVSAAQFLPVLVFGLFGGLIADAVPKRATLLATQTTMMLLAFVLAALTLAEVVQVWEVVAIAFLLGFANAVDMPTRQSFVIEMVGREDIGNAVALNSALFNMARIAGPALAGILIGLVGVAVCFLLNGLSFIAVIASLLLMRDEDLMTHRVRHLARNAGDVMADLAEGLRYVRRTPVVLLAVVVVGLVSLFGLNLNVLVPVYATGVLGVGAVGFGLLMTASAFGSLAAALAIAYVGRPSPRLIVGGALVLGLLEMALWQIHAYPAALAALFGVGVGSIVMTATANTSIQLAVPDDLRGRVISVYTTVFTGTTPFGALFAGAIASGLGAGASFFVGGAISAAVAVVAWLVARPWLASLPRQAPEPAGR